MMIAFIKGQVADIAADSVTLENQDVGYRIFCNIRDLSDLEMSQQIKIYTEMIVREDDLSLFGFLNPLDRVIFNRLRSVSGIGSKTALNVLNMLSGREIIQLVVEENHQFLTRVPGIGKKTAGRIILELKDSFIKEYGEDASLEIQAPVQSADPSFDELKLALTQLGYAKQEISEVIKKLDPKEDLETQLRRSLALLARW